MKIWRLWVQSRLGAIFYFAPLCQCWQDSAKIWQKIANYRKTPLFWATQRAYRSWQEHLRVCGFEIWCKLDVLLDILAHILTYLFMFVNFAERSVKSVRPHRCWKTMSGCDKFQPIVVKIKNCFHYAIIFYFLELPEISKKGIVNNVRTGDSIVDFTFISCNE